MAFFGLIIMLTDSGVNGSIIEAMAGWDNFSVCWEGRLAVLFGSISMQFLGEIWWES